MSIPAFGFPLPAPTNRMIEEEKAARGGRFKEQKKKKETTEITVPDLQTLIKRTSDGSTSNRVKVKTCRTYEQMTPDVSKGEASALLLLGSRSSWQPHTRCRTELFLAKQ